MPDCVFASCIFTCELTEYQDLYTYDVLTQAQTLVELAAFGPGASFFIFCYSLCRNLIAIFSAFR